MVRRPSCLDWTLISLSAFHIFRRDDVQQIVFLLFWFSSVFRHKDRPEKEDKKINTTSPSLPNAADPTCAFTLSCGWDSQISHSVWRIPVTEAIWVYFKQNNTIKHSSNNHDSSHSFPLFLPLDFLFECLYFYPTIIHLTVQFHVIPTSTGAPAPYLQSHCRRSPFQSRSFTWNVLRERNKTHMQCKITNFIRGKWVMILFQVTIVGRFIYIQILDSFPQHFLVSKWWVIPSVHVRKPSSSTKTKLPRVNQRLT